MVQAMVNISNQANQILNIVKAKYDLHDKSEAIEKVVIDYGKDFLEPQLRPEYVNKLKEIDSGKFLSEQEFKKELGEI